LIDLIDCMRTVVHNLIRYVNTTLCMLCLYSINFDIVPVDKHHIRQINYHKNTQCFGMHNILAASSSTTLIK